MSYNFHPHDLKSSESSRSSAFSNHSCQANFSTCTGFDSDHKPSLPHRVSSDCMSCLKQPNAVECCGISNNTDEHHDLSGCIDPGCDDVICDDCSIHEDCCNDCDVDCDLDCDISFGCDDTYAFGGSDTELFGDQTAQTFGFGCPLPPLQMENSMIEPCDFGKIPDSTLSPRCYPGTRPQPRLFLPNSGTFNKQHDPAQATPYRSAFHGPSSNEITSAPTPLPTRNITSLMHSSSSAPSESDCPPNAHYDHINLPVQKNDSMIPFPSSRCEWADSNGEPCGKIVKLGEDMHEHLKSSHAVKTEVFCRWLGCCAGILGPTPHKFASSVERHTWGHSGYRPYKCPMCNEGFAAASVRKEHITNIHERKKIFACDMCSHHCTSATNLKRHKDDKHSDERFQCEFCNKHGKRRLFPRGSNLTRHFRNCKYVQAEFPDAAAAGKTKADWLPPGYKRGHHGMDRAKIRPPKYLPT